ncbi:hypothetical protein GQX74_007608 [Glossina fuscipes]|nr:hypothetical protein GQX74_007608 [Glossina fuscipes]
MDMNTQPCLNTKVKWGDNEEEQQEEQGEIKLQRNGKNNIDAMQHDTIWLYVVYISSLVGHISVYYTICSVTVYGHYSAQPYVPTTHAKAYDKSFLGALQTLVPLPFVASVALVND